MTPLQELTELLTGKSRAIMLAERDVDLRGSSVENRIFILTMVEGSLAAGGRGAGFGERRVIKVALFRLFGGSCEKTYETEEESMVNSFEIPYYVSRLPFTLADGTEAVGYGVVDPELVAEYAAKAR